MQSYNKQIDRIYDMLIQDLGMEKYDYSIYIIRDIISGTTEDDKQFIADTLDKLKKLESKVNKIHVKSLKNHSKAERKIKKYEAKGDKEKCEKYENEIKVYDDLIDEADGILYRLTEDIPILERKLQSMNNEQKKKEHLISEIKYHKGKVKVYTSELEKLENMIQSRKDGQSEEYKGKKYPGKLLNKEPRFEEHRFIRFPDILLDQIREYKYTKYRNVHNLNELSKQPYESTDPNPKPKFNREFDEYIELLKQPMKYPKLKTKPKSKSKEKSKKRTKSKYPKNHPKKQRSELHSKPKPEEINISIDTMDPIISQVKKSELQLIKYIKPNKKLIKLNMPELQPIKYVDPKSELHIHIDFLTKLSKWGKEYKDIKKYIDRSENDIDSDTVSHLAEDDMSVQQMIDYKNSSECEMDIIAEQQMIDSDSEPEFTRENKGDMKIEEIDENYVTDDENYITDSEKDYEDEEQQIKEISIEELEYNDTLEDEPDDEITPQIDIDDMIEDEFDRSQHPKFPEIRDDMTLEELEKVKSIIIYNRLYHEEIIEKLEEKLKEM